MSALRFRQLLILVTGGLFVLGFFWVDNWRETMVNGDSSGYYMHVVSALVNQDVGQYDQTIDDYLKNYPQAADPREDVYGIRLTEKGRRYIKYTLGVGLLQVPFFGLAHLIASLSPAFPADGWSFPYMLLIHLSKVVYIFWGLYLLSGLLLRSFSRWITALTIVVVAFGTNLFYHGTFLTLAHSYLFFAFSLLMVLAHRFYDRPSLGRAFGIGLVVGLIALTRVPEVVGLCVPLLWGVRSASSLRERIAFFRQRPQYLGLAGIGLLLVFSPQIAYWQYVSGEWFFNPYQGESFNFLKPRIHRGWFSFKNGWLIYTPVMIFALWGFGYARKKAPQVVLPAATFLLLNAWIHYSYYVWNYYPGLGSRPMIEVYPLLSFCLAAFADRFWSNRWSRRFLLLGSIFFIALNLHQSWQMRRGIIWSQQGNMAFYAETFGRMTSTRNALRAYDSHSFQPDEGKLIAADTLLYEAFSSGDTLPLVTHPVSSAPRALEMSADFTHYRVRLDAEEWALTGGSWLYVAVDAYRPGSDMVWVRWKMENLELSLWDEKGRRRLVRSIKIMSHVGNDKHSIWSCGTPDQWGEAGFYLRLPRNISPGWQLEVAIANPDEFRLFVDNLRLIRCIPKTT